MFETNGVIKMISIEKTDECIIFENEYIKGIRINIDDNVKIDLSEEDFEKVKEYWLFDLKWQIDNDFVSGVESEKDFAEKQFYNVLQKNGIGFGIDSYNGMHCSFFIKKEDVVNFMDFLNDFENKEFNN